MKAILSKILGKTEQEHEPDRLTDAARESRRREKDAEIKREVLLYQHDIETRLNRILDAEAAVVRRS
jgi:hypothetical protein